MPSDIRNVGVNEPVNLLVSNRTHCSHDMMSFAHNNPFGLITIPRLIHTFFTQEADGPLPREEGHPQPGQLSVADATWDDFEGYITSLDGDFLTQAFAKKRVRSENGFSL